MAWYRRRCWALLLASVAAGCGLESHPVQLALQSGPDAGSALQGCADDGNVPQTLYCTGLYADLASKVVASGVEAYAPAAALWSDGAEKHRWIYLPPGSTIDVSSPNDWVFPVGTRVWKEFKVNGKRIETRLWRKVRADWWQSAAYVWSRDESQADFSFGGDITIEGGSYHVPIQSECDDCHDGQKDHLLGVEQISLGLPGATGMNLAELANRGWLSARPERIELSIGDDGTGLAAQALSILHANCGVSCHNGNPNATANLTTQNLRLDASKLDGRAPDGTWNVFRTAVGKSADSVQWRSALRIVPGDPDASLLVQLMSSRGGDGNGQMPPIATRVVDEQGLATIREWITRLGSQGDAGADAAVDSGGPLLELDASSAPDADGDAGGAAALDAGSGSDASEPEDASFALDGSAAPDALDGDLETDAAASDPDTGVADVD